MPPMTSLLPHTGTMVMLDEIAFADDQRIVCTTTRHQALDNPLRVAGGLPALCGVEFAAQAAAVHGALCSGQNAALHGGRVASVRDIVAPRRFIHDLDGVMHIECRLEARFAMACAYAFTLSSVGLQVLAGRIMLAMPDRGSP